MINKQESIPVGCVPSAAVVAGGGGCASGGMLPLGVCFPVGVLPRGDVCIPACTGKTAPTLVNRMTDACKNITFPQLRCGW